MKAFMDASVEVASVEAFMEFSVVIASVEASVEVASVEASVEAFMEASIAWKLGSFHCFHEIFHGSHRSFRGGRRSLHGNDGSFHGSFHELPQKNADNAGGPHFTDITEKFASLPYMCAPHRASKYGRD